MTSVTATKFRQNIFNYLSETIKYNSPMQVTTKEGNAVVISEQDYNALQETLYLVSIPDMRETIIEGLDTPLDECVSEDEVEW
jgi:PHD/YefM family antitoxin component YafN of YafNO toxin-antitoxin module